LLLLRIVRIFGDVRLLNAMVTASSGAADRATAQS
jgi:hypothetical protein